MFKGETLLLFQNLIKLFRSLAINNQLLSAQDTNYAIINTQPNDHPPIWMFRIVIQYYELSNQSNILNCYGTKGTASKLPGGFYANIDRYDYAGSTGFDSQMVNPSTSMINATVILPGIFIGCLPMKSLLTGAPGIMSLSVFSQYLVHFSSDLTFLFFNRFLV